MRLIVLLMLIRPPINNILCKLIDSCILYFLRPCGSYDALISPQQQLPSPDLFQLHGNCKHNQLYTCSSECSDHSLKTHSHHSSHSSQEKSKLNCTERCNGNGIYENGTKEEQECMINNMHCLDLDHDRQSECCSSKEDGEGDTCCSCSERSSCLYAEAGDPTHRVQLVPAAQN